MDVLQKEQPPLLTRLEIAHDTALAMAHMHSTGFVHRDVKSLNYFLTDGGEQSGVRLGDFGESVTNAAAEGEIPKQVGTPQWMAPELVSQEAPDTLTRADSIF